MRTHNALKPETRANPIMYLGPSSEGKKYAPKIPDKLAMVLTQARLTALTSALMGAKVEDA